MVYIIPYLVVAVIALAGCRIDLKNKFNTLERNFRMNDLRGIVAIMIVFSHTTLPYTRLPLVLFPVSKISTPLVGYFFVMSGFGLAYSYHNKENYLKGFLKNKLLHLALVGVIVALIGGVLRRIAVAIVGIRISIGIINWYIFAQGIAYIVFYLCYTHIQSRKGRVCAMYGVITASCLVFMLLHANRSFFISELGFAFGITVYEYRKKLDEWLDKRHALLVGITVIGGAASVLSFFVRDYTVWDLLLHNMLVVSTYMAVFLLSNYIQLGNKVLLYLKKISLELYLYQFPIFMTLIYIYIYFNRGIDVFYILIAMAADVVVASVMHPVNKAIWRRIYGVLFLTKNSPQ